MLIKALAGGSLVVLFALLSESLAPKRFAGLFGVAPAVAIAGLAVTLVSKGVLDARDDTLGMVAGSAGLAAYACATVLLLKRVSPLASSVSGLAVWGAVAAAIAVPPAMSSDKEKGLTWFEAPSESPTLDFKRSRGVSLRDLLIRFAFGAGTSAVAGVMSVVWNARTAGIMLAFPAILAASLTLIADAESRRAAREDARGAVIGAFGLAAFAFVCYASFGHLPPVLVLVLALSAWVCVACGVYLVLWAPSRGVLRRR